MASTPSARASTAQLWGAARSVGVALAVMLLGLALALDGIRLEQSVVAGSILLVAGVVFLSEAALRIRRAVRHRREAAPRA